MYLSPIIKSRENSIIDLISDKIKIPEYNRFIDVNIGKGELFFWLCPIVPCHVNDPNRELIDFYNSIKENELQTEIDQFATNWSLIQIFNQFLVSDIYMTYKDFARNIIDREDLQHMIRAIVVMNMDNEEFNPLFEKRFIVSLDMYLNSLIKSISDELIRLKADSDLPDSESSVPSDFFTDSIETALCNGFYCHFQNLINWQKTDLINCINRHQQLAFEYFINFFSKEGKLYIDEYGNNKNHYGGPELNKVDFYEVSELIKSGKIVDLLTRTQFHNQSLHQFIKDINLNLDDFVIADFTKTNNVVKNKNEHLLIDECRNLVKFLVDSPARWMVITESKHAAELQEISSTIYIDKLEKNDQISFALRNFQ